MLNLMSHQQKKSMSLASLPVENTEETDKSSTNVPICNDIKLAGGAVFGLRPSDGVTNAGGRQHPHEAYDRPGDGAQAIEEPSDHEQNIEEPEDLLLPHPDIHVSDQAEQAGNVVVENELQLDQHRALCNGDFITCLDNDSNQWLRAKIILKSNYPMYFNIQYLDSDRPDAGLYLQASQSWSFIN